jgi:hypothetical protein
MLYISSSIFTLRSAECQAMLIVTRASSRQLMSRCENVASTGIRNKQSAPAAIFDLAQPRNLNKMPLRFLRV